MISILRTHNTVRCIITGATDTNGSVDASAWQFLHRCTLFQSWSLTTTLMIFANQNCLSVNNSVGKYPSFASAHCVYFKHPFIYPCLNWFLRVKSLIRERWPNKGPSPNIVQQHSTLMSKLTNSGWRRSLGSCVCRVRLHFLCDVDNNTNAVLIIVNQCTHPPALYIWLPATRGFYSIAVQLKVLYKLQTINMVPNVTYNGTSC